jgi:glycosyltransferase involved in cell wall biosynthesis
MDIIRKIARRLLRNDAPDIHSKTVSLRPDTDCKGNVLIAYIIDPFLRKEGEPISDDHTHYWESFQMAQTFLSHGYAVDVISYENSRFVPGKHYDYFISARTHLETIAARLNSDCIKVAHLDTAHWLFNNHAAYERLYALQQRRTVTLKGSIRIVEPNQAIEVADVATVLGNQFTLDSYGYAGKPIHRIPISSPTLYPWNDTQDIEQRRSHYLWFGSSGFVHKGLDLALEAFAQTPEVSLTVCGPFQQEKGFIKAFHKELYETPNIKAVGWVDVNSPAFLDIARNCIGLVYPSCAEGGGGSAITCMHAAIIPLLSYEASVDIAGHGVLLKESSVTGIIKGIRKVSAMSSEELYRLSRGAWEYARQHHTREVFTREYDDFVSNILLKGR